MLPHLPSSPRSPHYLQQCAALTAGNQRGGRRFRGSAGLAAARCSPRVRRSCNSVLELVLEVFQELRGCSGRRNFLVPDVPGETWELTRYFRVAVEPVF